MIARGSRAFASGVIGFGVARSLVLSRVEKQEENRIGLGVLATSGSLRVARTVWAATLVSSDYALLDYRAKFAAWRSGEEGEWEKVLEAEKEKDWWVEAQSRVHKRSAERVLGVCERNGGVFLKAAQYLSTLGGALPKEWTGTLSRAQDSAPVSNRSAVEEIILAELGKKVEEVYAEFDWKPLAAASIAQVHRAKLLSSGREVAVKVQHPGLQRRSLGDVVTLRVIAAVVAWWWPEFEFRWVLPDLEESLAREMDFIQEAITASRAGRVLESHHRVHVPEVEWEWTTRRLLTMEFIKGRPATDTKYLEEISAPSREVAAATIRALATLINVHGLCHCDPHPGNVMVEGLENGEWRVVLLDHGMYRRISRSFREAYCSLWQAMVQGDTVLGVKACRALGSPEPEFTFDALSLALTFRPAGSSSSLGTRISQEERERLRDKYAKTTAEDIQNLMRSLPRDMLFVMRSTNLLRGLNFALGGSSRDRFLAIADAATEGAVVSALSSSVAALQIWKDATDECELEARTQRTESAERTMGSKQHCSKLIPALRSAFQAPHGWAGLVEEMMVERGGGEKLQNFAASKALAARLNLPPPITPLAEPNAEINLPVDAELPHLASLFANPTHPLHDALLVDPVVQEAQSLAKSRGMESVSTTAEDFLTSSLRTIAVYTSIATLRAQIWFIESLYTLWGANSGVEEASEMVQDHSRPQPKKSKIHRG